MSVAGLMFVKDEADVIEHSVGWALTQVDEIYVYDNGSTDGTRQILNRFTVETGRVHVFDDDRVGYWQAQKTTELARLAWERGHSWAVPIDADEFWRCADPAGRIGDHLEGIGQGYHFAAATLFDHKVTLGDPPDEPNPALRMRWRFREPARLPKIAVRLSPEVEIGMGNHEASVEAREPQRIASDGSMSRLDGTLVVEHYSWRSAGQMVRKITNGARAYAAASLPDHYGGHWRAFGMPEDEGFEDRVRSWFYQWGFTGDPHDDPDIMFSPFPSSAPPAALV